MKRELQELSEVHHKRGLFGTSWSRENLWTLYSLQEGVSRFRDQPGGSDRGQGTVKLIDFFQRLGKTLDGQKPQMCILSGSTHILFDGTYEMRAVTKGHEKRQIISFNESNDLWERPDDRYVKSIRGVFPGTLISMSFFLDRKYLEREGEGRK